MRYLCVFIYLCTFTCTVFVKRSLSISFRQERAEIKYSNPKYCRDSNVYTARKGRGAPYLTNITNTILHTWDNNVTAAISFNNLKGQSFVLTHKVCDIYNKLWWVRRSVTRALTYQVTCPFKPGTYLFMNLEIPKEIPLTEPGDYSCVLTFLLTNTKIRLIEFTMKLRALDEKKKPSSR